MAQKILLVVEFARSLIDGFVGMASDAEEIRKV